MKRSYKSLSSISMMLALAGIMAGCDKEKVEDRGLSDPNLNADFTVSSVGGSANRYSAKVADSSYIGHKWDMGDGSGAAIGKATQEMFFPDAGTYTITHTAIGKGGSTATATKTVTVATSDPSKGNLVQGGKFETSADDAKWSRLVISQPAITWTMSGGKMTAAGGSWGHSAIYQPITVEANKEYVFKMQVSGSGATDTWFEVYFGTAAPTQNNDYSSGGNQIALNTWSGCGNTTFNGNISTIGCAGALVGKNGVVKFNQAGTVYLLIKTGGANLGTSGISIDNVELRGK